ncbi:MAG: hypothetical protein CVV25_12325 [Ignavibacteriae bacterium HGW-Ignavibacteriae-4]|jgi:uncharacterized RDD family membrane protein YckC|nr:MAG: hypothetical protein CVV25_12325 [Ignavibacteriae bacterium HGW-Ignavibacteriae-4]
MLKSNFQNKTTTELKKIISTSNSYLPEAVLVAFELLEERGINFSDDEIELRNKLIRKIDFKNEKVLKNEHSLFKKRIFSFILDFLFLSIISYIIGFLFIDSEFLRFPYEPIFSFTLVLFYFAYFNSSLSKGTIGMRVMELSIVNSNNEKVSLKTSLFRYFLLVIPFFLSQNLEYLLPNTYNVDKALFWIYIFSIFYFIINDKESRRSYHDILSNTTVTSSSNSFSPSLVKKKDLKVYTSVVSFIAIFFISIGVIFSPNTSNFEYQSTQTELLSNNIEKAFSKYNSVTKEISEIKNIDKVSEVNLIETNGNRRVLKFVARPKLFSNRDNIISEFEKIIKNNKEVFTNIDNVNLELEYNINMTLAIFNLKNKSFQIRVGFGEEDSSLEN